MYKQILVPVDGSATSNAGLAEAVKMAELTGGRLRLLHVIDEMPFAMSTLGGPAASASLLAVLEEGGQAVLRQAREQVEKSGVAVDTVLFDGFGGRLSDRVAEQARTWPADLVVLGTHGRRGVGRMLIGSDAEQVLRTAPVPVLLVRGDGTQAK